MSIFCSGPCNIRHLLNKNLVFYAYIVWPFGYIPFYGARGAKTEEKPLNNQKSLYDSLEIWLY